jgi:hypothetical protein
MFLPTERDERTTKLSAKSFSRPMEGVLLPVIRCGDVEIDAQQECVRHGGIEQLIRRDKKTC